MNGKLFEEVLKEEHLREMADVNPNDMAFLIRSTFTEQWHIALNRLFTIRIAKIAIEKQKKKID
jgi:hypothetical protein